MLSIQIRAYDALNFQHGTAEPGTISQRLRFQVKVDCTAKDLGNFFSTLNIRRIAWQHLSGGLYEFLVPHEQSIQCFEDHLGRDYDFLGRIVPFVQDDAIAVESREDERFPSTKDEPPEKFSRWGFRVNGVYNKAELRGMMAICEARGAWFRHVRKGLYEIRVPDTIDCEPFSLTLDDCPSVTNIRGKRSREEREES